MLYAQVSNPTESSPLHKGYSSPRPLLFAAHSMVEAIPVEALSSCHASARQYASKEGLFATSTEEIELQKQGAAKTAVGKAAKLVAFLAVESACPCKCPQLRPDPF